VETPIGNLPAPGALDLTGLNLANGDVADLLAVDVEAWKKEAQDIAGYYAKFGDRLPAALHQQLAELIQRLNSATA